MLATQWTLRRPGHPTHQERGQGHHVYSEASCGPDAPAFVLAALATIISPGDLVQRKRIESTDQGTVKGI